MKNLFVLFIISLSAALSIVMVVLRNALAKTYPLHAAERFLFNWGIAFVALIFIFAVVAIAIP